MRKQQQQPYETKANIKHHRHFAKFGGPLLPASENKIGEVYSSCL